ncbi:MAG: Maf family protein [Myxococcota bacterium]
MNSPRHDVVEEPLVLASGSPRRRDLLRSAGLDCEIHPPEISEDGQPGERPSALVKRLARRKAMVVAERLGVSPRRLVLGADTVVVRNGVILGKPRDADHALALLSTLVGGQHQVITGIAVVDSASLAHRAKAVESWVTMRPASLEELRAYVATGEPLDKAGAYALQGEGRRFVLRVEGSESNVIGLPVEQTLALLREVRESDGETTPPA